MRINQHWTRNNIPTKPIGLFHLLARIIEYKNSNPESKLRACIIHFKCNGKIIIHLTAQNLFYYSQFPAILFQQRDVIWNAHPHTLSFHYRQDNETELRTFLTTINQFDSSFSEISSDILELLMQFKHPDYHHDSARVTFFGDEVVTKSGVRREREEESVNGNTQ